MVKAKAKVKVKFAEAEVAAGIALVLSDKQFDGHTVPREDIIRDLLLHLPDPPEPEAATEAARMIVLVDKANGQKLRSSGV